VRYAQTTQRSGRRAVSKKQGCLWRTAIVLPTAMRGRRRGHRHQRPPSDAPPKPARSIPVPVLIVLAVAVGCVGGIYGIGGGSILAPVLVGSGRKPSEVAPATLASTFVTSVAGVITFTILAINAHVHAAPDWPTGIALGVGGLAGAYTGARAQSRLPELLIRRVMAALVVAIGIRYLIAGLM
jgi:uncharacterized protein